MIKIAKLSFAHVHARGYANQILENPETELVAVWDEEEYGGKQAAEEYNVPFYSDLDQVLAQDDIDAVVVDAITSDHPRVMIAAAEAGKHIFTEKALAITVDECDRIIEAVEGAGVKFMISLPSRCNPDLVFGRKPLMMVSWVISPSDVGVLHTRRDWINGSQGPASGLGMQSGLAAVLCLISVVIGWTSSAGSWANRRAPSPRLTTSRATIQLTTTASR